MSTLYPWHLFGYIITLLGGERCRKGHIAPLTSQVARDLTEDKLRTIRGQNTKGTSDLLDLIKEKIPPLSLETYPWTDNAFSNLAVQMVEMPPDNELGKFVPELVLTADTLFVPTSLYWGDSLDPKAKQAYKDAYAEVKKDTTPFTVYQKPTTDFMNLRATLDTVDVMVECPKDNRRILNVEDEDLREELDTLAKELGHGELGTFKAVKLKNDPTTKTRIKIEGDGSMTLMVGTQKRSENAGFDKNRFKQIEEELAAEGYAVIDLYMIGEMPCGPLTLLDRECH